MLLSVINPHSSVRPRAVYRRMVVLVSKLCRFSPCILQRSTRICDTNHSVPALFLD